MYFLRLRRTGASQCWRTPRRISAARSLKSDTCSMMIRNWATGAMQVSSRACIGCVQETCLSLSLSAACVRVSNRHDWLSACPSVCLSVCFIFLSVYLERLCLSTTMCQRLTTVVPLTTHAPCAGLWHSGGGETNRLQKVEGLR
jgi:hypothetical protein